VYFINKKITKATMIKVKRSPKKAPIRKTQSVNSYHGISGGKKKVTKGITRLSTSDWTRFPIY